MLHVLGVWFVLSWLPFAILSLGIVRTNPFKTISDLHAWTSCTIKSKPHKWRAVKFWSKTCICWWSQLLQLTETIYLFLFYFVNKGKLHTFKTKSSFLYYIYEVHTISFKTFFEWAFKIIIDSWKFSMLLLYILWDDWPIFMISGSNEQLQHEFEYTLLKPDCHSWWISKMQSDTLEERYAIKLCFKLGKNATETYGMLQTAFEASCMNQASDFESHKRFKEGRESVRDDERCGRSKESQYTRVD